MRPLASVNFWHDPLTVSVYTGTFITWSRHGARHTNYSINEKSFLNISLSKLGLRLTSDNISPYDLLRNEIAKWVKNGRIVKRIIYHIHKFHGTVQKYWKIVQ